MNRTVVAGLSLLSVVSAAMAQAILPPFPPPPAPPEVRLTDTNTTPMQTKEMRVFADVRGLYATVETTLVFHNPNQRDLEGELVFPLPDGAAVCGYALDINGAMVDGVVVKKEKARVAFESETRRRVDPGLVEHVKGNLYKTRIYPLPAGGDRTIWLTYTTPLAASSDGSVALALPQPRAPMAKRSVRIEVVRDFDTPPVLGGLGDAAFAAAENVWRVEKTEENVTPDADILVALPVLPPQVTALEKAEDGSIFFAISDLAPAALAEAAAPPAPTAYTVFWDASASRGTADHEKEYALLAALPSGSSFELVVFRNVAEPVRSFADAAALTAALREIRYDGGTDFSQIAAGAEGAALLFTDGLDTLADAPMTFAGVAPVAVVSQTVADRESLRQACGGRLVDLQITAPEAAVQEIIAPAPRVAGLDGTGIAQVQGVGQPAAGRVRLLGRLTADEAVVRMATAPGVFSVPITLRAADAREGRVLATAWAAARVNQLAPRADNHADELLALGRRYGLVSPATSLIVLESLDQWVRHEIEPPASLPAMREQYLQAMKNRGNNGDGPAARSLRHVEELKKAWENRVAWWKDPSGFAPSKDSIPSEPSGAEPRGLWARAVSHVAGRNQAVASSSRDEQMMVSDSLAEPRLMAMEAAPTGDFDAAPAGNVSAIQIKEWSPSTPYLTKIRKAKTPATREKAYFQVRADWAQSPAFFLDCADAFLAAGDRATAMRILSNLAELRMEDAALLRVYAWRLQQAGEFDGAIRLFRRIARLRPEEAQSFRDLALALAERGRATAATADLEEAMGLLHKVAFTAWNRQDVNIALFALEEMNALAAWCDAQKWPEGTAPVRPETDEVFRAHLDLDIRIVMSWDADATDIDLHVIDPSGEEAYYGHRYTVAGGLVSRDITDGYGPEEFLLRKAPAGDYAIQSKYYGSSQQTVTGPATVTATVFTDWGRPQQKKEVLTLRLDKVKDMVPIGSIRFGAPDGNGGVTTPDGGFAALRPGMTREEVTAALGARTPGEDGLYTDGAKSYRLDWGEDARLLRVTEILPGGVETILVQ